MSKKKKPAPKPVKKAKAVAKPALKAKAAKKWSGGAERAKAAKKQVAAAKQPPLIKGLRIRALDKVFEQIADTRAALNRLRSEEADLERHAHRLMREHKQATWTWAGVEGSRVPGDEKLRIRTSRETSTAQSDETEPRPPANEDDVDPELLEGNEDTDELGDDITVGNPLDDADKNGTH